MTLGVTSGTDRSSMRAKACSELHARLFGHLTMSKLFSTPLSAITAAAEPNVAPGVSMGSHLDPGKITAGLQALTGSLDQLTMADVVGQSQHGLSAEALSAIQRARKAGLAIAAPTEDAHLLEARHQAIARLMSEASGVTVAQIATGDDGSIPADAGPAVYAARTSGILPQKTAANATFVGMQVTFHTNDDDKDDDTVVGVGLLTDTYNTIASIDNTFGYFDDNSTHGPFSLAISSGYGFPVIQNSLFAMGISPNGHDTWHFNVLVTVLFSDGSSYSGTSQNMQLTQDDRNQTQKLSMIIPSLLGTVV